jgi:hypothetical protein
MVFSAEYLAARRVDLHVLDPTVTGDIESNGVGEAISPAFECRGHDSRSGNFSERCETCHSWWDLGLRQ